MIKLNTSAGTLIDEELRAKQPDDGVRRISVEVEEPGGRVAHATTGSGLRRDRRDRHYQRRRAQQLLRTERQRTRVQVEFADAA